MSNKFSTTDAEKILNIFLKEFRSAFRKLGIRHIDFFEHKNCVGARFWYPRKGKSDEYEIKLRKVNDD